MRAPAAGGGSPRPRHTRPLPAGYESASLISYFTSHGVRGIQPGENPANWMLDVAGGSAAGKAAAGANFVEVYKARACVLPFCVLCCHVLAYVRVGFWALLFSTASKIAQSPPAHPPTDLHLSPHPRPRT